MLGCVRAVVAFAALPSQRHCLCCRCAVALCVSEMYSSRAAPSGWCSCMPAYIHGATERLCVRMYACERLVVFQCERACAYNKFVCIELVARSNISTAMHVCERVCVCKVVPSVDFVVRFFVLSIGQGRIFVQICSKKHMNEMSISFEEESEKKECLKMRAQLLSISTTQNPLIENLSPSR